MKGLTVLWELLYPTKCAFCGKVMSFGGGAVCDECREHLPFLADHEQVIWGSFGKCAVTFAYKDMVKEGIHGLKFHGREASAKVLASYLAATAAEHLGGEFDTVTFVPVSRQRRRERGYDQGECIAREAAKLWHTPLTYALQKIRDNVPQSSLTDPQARRENVRDCYRAVGDIAGRRFLLVDDVITTGSTMTEAAETLLQAGAASVVCAAVASPQR